MSTGIKSDLAVNLKDMKPRPVQKSKPVRQHPSGQYRFLRGSAAFSSGVAAERGFEITHVKLLRSVEWKWGLARVGQYLQAHCLQLDALCGAEFRCPSPHTLTRFSEFNDQYVSLLADYGLMLNGQNPLARTNVVPAIDPPTETQLHAFSYVQASATNAATFVISGAAELPHRELDTKHIVRLAETSPAAMTEKAACTAGIIRHRLNRLQLNDSDVTEVSVYTTHPIGPIIEPILAAELPSIAESGVLWQYCRPPVIDLEFEMSAQGIRNAIVVEF